MRKTQTFQATHLGVWRFGTGPPKNWSQPILRRPFLFVYLLYTKDMNTVAIDTYKTINKLKAKGFTEQQAEGIIDTITESDLVTVTYFKTELARALSETKYDLIKWMAAMLIAQSAAIVALQSLIN